jgi:hypothetical protein
MQSFSRERYRQPDEPDYGTRLLLEEPDWIGGSLRVRLPFHVLKYLELYTSLGAKGSELKYPRSGWLIPAIFRVRASRLGAGY